MLIRTIILLCLISTPMWAGSAVRPHVKNRLLIKRKKSQDNYIAGINNYLSAGHIKKYQKSKIELLTFGSDHSIEEAVFLYSQDPSIEFVEPDYLIYATDLMPDDTNFAELWGLHNNGGAQGLADVDINAPRMWDSISSDQPINVAIIDSGVNYTHEDLAANMWQNPGEIAANGLDDDLNGYIDDIYGINTSLDNSDPMDDNGHGSHVAGVLGGVANNAKGISGVITKAKIVVCKFLDANGSGSTSDAIECLDYILALKTRANLPVNIVVTNNSWASGAFSQSLYEAIDRHLHSDIAFVAAADNNGKNNDLNPSYPASYDLANIISVAAIDNLGNLAKFSNFGVHSVHVSAPGVHIKSTVLGNAYAFMDGTSMATPLVSGVLGVLSGYYPQNSMVQNKNLVIASQKKLAALSAKTMGSGMLRAADDFGVGALTCDEQRVFQSVYPKTDIFSSELGQAIVLRALNINCADPAGAFSGTLSPGNQTCEFLDDGQGPDLSADDGVYSSVITPEEPGNYELSLDGQYLLNVEVFDSSEWQDYEFSQDEKFLAKDFAGQKLNIKKGEIYTLKLPFLIPFAKDPRGLSHLYISSNGTISFTHDQVPDEDDKNLANSEVKSLLAPLWLDLELGSNQPYEGVFYDVSGEAPNRLVLVEWRNFKHLSSPGRVTFQVILHEDSESITFAYKNLDFKNSNLDGGKTATIGVQVNNNGLFLPSDLLPIANNSSFSFRVLAKEEPALSPLNNSAPKNSGTGGSGGKSSANFSEVLPMSLKTSDSNYSQASISQAPSIEAPDLYDAPKTSLDILASPLTKSESESEKPSKSTSGCSLRGSDHSILFLFLLFLLALRKPLKTTRSHT